MTSLARLRLRALAIAALALAVAGACTGPEPRLSFGGKAVAVNVAFGNPDPDDPRAPEEPTELRPVGGGVGVVPVLPSSRRAESAERPPEPSAPPATTTTTAARPLTVACPPQDPFLFPAEATRQVDAPAPEGTYPFRVTGSSTVGEEEEPLGGTIEKVVEHAEAHDDGSLSFEVVTTLADVTTRESWVVQPAADRVAGHVGLAAVEAQGRGIDQTPSFTALKPVKLLQLKPEPGLAWQDATSDPLTGTVFSYDAEVVGKGRINACGAPIDAWEVKATQRVVTPNQDVTSTRTTWFATQYGGLIVQEAVTWSGRAGVEDVSGEYTATINQVPGEEAS